VDEVDIHLNPRIGRDWMLPGMQRRIVTPGKDEKRYLVLSTKIIHLDGCPPKKLHPMTGRGRDPQPVSAVITCRPGSVWADERAAWPHIGPREARSLPGPILAPPQSETESLRSSANVAAALLLQR
jgi:hypothetical protein